jgi:hypothetical protein
VSSNVQILSTLQKIGIPAASRRPNALGPVDVGPGLPEPEPGVPLLDKHFEAAYHLHHVRAGD